MGECELWGEFTMKGGRSGSGGVSVESVGRSLEVVGIICIVGERGAGRVRIGLGRKIARSSKKPL